MLKNMNDEERRQWERDNPKQVSLPLASSNRVAATGDRLFTAAQMSAATQACPGKSEFYCSFSSCSMGQ